MEKHEITIIGAGPAGLSAAIKLREEDFRVTVYEKAERGRRKPCGGILTKACIDILKYELNLELPLTILTKPEKLKLKLISPSSFEGTIRGYTLYNTDRRKFDLWLTREAEKREALIKFNTKLISLNIKNNQIQLTFIDKKGRYKKAKCQYLIGADGILSKVRRYLLPNLNLNPHFILQKYLEGRGEFEEAYHMYILNHNTTPLYGYVIPKGRKIIVGIGTPYPERTKAKTYLNRFIEHLKKYYSLKYKKTISTEGWYIPSGITAEGYGNIILAGDAGGFCNPFSGEGIRFAIETGIAAATSLKRKEENYHKRYSKEIEEITHFIRKTSKYYQKLKHTTLREEFVRKEIMRKSIY